MFFSDVKVKKRGEKRRGALSKFRTACKIVEFLRNLINYQKGKYILII